MRIPKKLKLKFEGSIIIVGVGVGAAEVGGDLAVAGALGACVAGVSDIVIVVVVICLFFWRTPLRLVSSSSSSWYHTTGGAVELEWGGEGSGIGDNHAKHGSEIEEIRIIRGE